MGKNKDLNLIAKKLRIHSLKMTSKAGSGHPTTCMSMAEDAVQHQRPPGLGER